MNSESLISVIVAIYNGEKYLDDCVNSILKQTYTNIEIILVDDGSTDNSGNKCDEYAKKDNRIKVLHQKNGGVSVARNNALSVSNGDYICFMDQDDYLSDDYISYLFDLIKSNDAEISLVPHVVYSSKGKKDYLEKKSPTAIEIWSGEKAACEMLYSKMEIGPWSKMISKKLIDDNDIHFYEGIFGGEGYAFSVEAFAAAKKVAVGYKGIYFYRVDNYNSEMSKFRPRTLDSSIRAVKIMHDEFRNESKAVFKATKYAQWRVYVAFLNSLVASKMEKEYFEEYKQLIKYCRKYAYRSFTANVSIKRKIKDLLYFISPVWVSKINIKINNKRDFNKSDI